MSGELKPTGAMLAAGRDALEPYVGALKQPVSDQWQLARDVWAAMSLAAPADQTDGAGLREAVSLALDLAKRGADKAGCDGWRAQEMCRQIVSALTGNPSLHVSENGGGVEAINWKGEWEAVCGERIKDRAASQAVINERDAWIVELIRERDALAQGLVPTARAGDVSGQTEAGE